MLLKVTNLVSKTGKSPQGLKNDEMCRVVSIIVSLYKQTVEYRIVPEERKEFGTPAIYDQSHFEITDPQVESDWVVETSDAYVELIPKSLSYSTFWEDLYNDEPKAMELFYQRFPEFKFKTDEEREREELKKLTEHVTELLLQGKELYEVHRETGVDIDEVGDIYTKLVKGNKITPQKL